jgi:hypothetical protein
MNKDLNLGRTFSLRLGRESKLSSLHRYVDGNTLGNDLGDSSNRCDCGYMPLDRKHSVYYFDGAST